jgi:hypothetical protein
MLLDRPDRGAPSVGNLDGAEPARTAHQRGRVTSTCQGQSSARGDVRRTTDTEPVPRGWGSHEERRLMLLALATFFVLGLYASGFVVLGHVLSS